MMAEPVVAAKAASPPRAAGRLRMSLNVALDLSLCGALTAGLPFLARHLQSDLPRRTVVLGVVGGGLCVLWSVLGRLGLSCRGAAMITLAGLVPVFVVQVVQSLQAAAALESEGRVAAVLMVVLFVSCASTLASVAQEGRNARR